MNTPLLRHTLLSAVLIASTTGCSLNKLAVNKIGNALAGGGDTYAAMPRNASWPH